VKGLVDNSVYLRRYYAQRMRELAENYSKRRFSGHLVFKLNHDQGTFREVLVNRVGLREISHLLEYDDDSTQENTVKTISVLAGGGVFNSLIEENINPNNCKVNTRQKFFTPEIVSSLYQISAKAKKPAQVGMPPIIGMLLEDGT
jgi:hypothetical protein